MTTIATATATSSAPPHAFLARWTDHETWNEWDASTAWARLDGPAGVGVSGTLRPRGGPRTRFTISALTPASPVEYTDTARFPGARIVVRHLAAQVDDVTQLRVSVTTDGPLAGLYVRLLGPGFRRSLPSSLDRLVALVEAGA